MTEFNTLTNLAIAFGVMLAITWLFMIIFYALITREYNVPNIYKHWDRISKYPKLSFLPQSKAGLTILVLTVILFAATLGCGLAGANNQKTNLGIPIDRNTTTVDNPGTSSFGNVEHFGSTTTTYKPIGYGPALDKTKVQNWINGNAGSMGLNLASGKSAWVDGNDVPIQIPTEQFKALYGFIPPSFSYYPKGQTKNDYNETNYKTGREDCMKACSLTNCTAIQTEVPENCAQETDASGTGNACGSNSAFSCTLFFDNIKNADDGYWTLDNFSSGNGLSSSPGCFEVTGTSCLGKKYYEASAVPVELPNKISKPSQNIVTFCDSNVTSTNNAGYGNKSGSTSCSCTGTNCNDTNCCVMRPLLTTEYVQNKYPYYSLPINISKVTDDASGDYSMVVPSINYKNGTPSACGIVGSGVSQHLVSCTGSAACGSNSDTTDCWKVDTNSCSGDPFDMSTGASALSNYKAHYADSKGKNYDDLYPSCYYRQKLTVVQPVQFNCDSKTVTRGCWGSPSIIYTESLSSPNNFVACSDTTAIPNTQRCQNGTSSSLASCEGFPYSCGSNNGTSTLWVKQL